MNIDKYINDGQDPKTVEKLLLKLQDIMVSGEVITYIAVQKKPAVTLLPDTVSLSNKRIFLSEFTKLGLATNFEMFTWKDLKDIAFKEEIFGSKFTIIPFKGENLSIDYIPKNQARKLYQLATEALADYRDEQAKQDLQTSPHQPLNMTMHHEHPDHHRPLQLSEEPALKQADPEDELVKKLEKLKLLFEKNLITQDEYDTKKNELLSQL